MEKQTPKQVMQEFDQKTEALKKEFHEKLRLAVLNEGTTSTEKNTDTPLAGVWYKDGPDRFIFLKQVKGTEIKGYGFQLGQGFYHFDGKCPNGIPPVATFDDVEKCYHRTAHSLGLYPGVDIKFEDDAEEQTLGEARPTFTLVDKDGNKNVLTSGGIVVSKNGDWPKYIEGENVREKHDKHAGLEKLENFLAKMLQNVDRN